METTTVRTVHHAAHHGTSGASNLLEIDAIQLRPFPRPSLAIREGAEFHHGYIDKEGRQHFVFVKSIHASAESVCDRCKEAK